MPSIGDRLGETVYAVRMVVISIGLLYSGGQITQEHTAYVAAVAFTLNLWRGICPAYPRNLNHPRWPVMLVLGALRFALFAAAYAAGP